MMIKELKKAITASIFDVLETMFFMVIEVDDPDADEFSAFLNRKNIRGCRLDFQGLFSGEFILLVPLDLLSDMAVDFMGESPETITSQHTEGTLKEAVNMIAGNAFGHYDETLTFAIGIPEPIDPQQFKHILDSSGDQTISFKITTEKSVILIKVMIRRA